MNNEARILQRRLANRGGAQRMKDHDAVRKAGGTPRQAILAYCQGNVHLMENARAVGNLPPGC